MSKRKKDNVLVEVVKLSPKTDKKGLVFDVTVKEGSTGQIHEFTNISMYCKKLKVGTKLSLGDMVQLSLMSGGRCGDCYLSTSMDGEKDYIMVILGSKLYLAAKNLSNNIKANIKDCSIKSVKEKVVMYATVDGVEKEFVSISSERLNELMCLKPTDILDAKTKLLYCIGSLIACVNKLGYTPDSIRVSYTETNRVAEICLQ